MSGWSEADINPETQTGSIYPAINNITVRGLMPVDEVPSPKGSRNLVEANIKSLRAYRKWCRYMPFLIASLNLSRFTTPEQAKLHVAGIWKQNTRVRSIQQID